MGHGSQGWWLVVVLTLSESSTGKWRLRDGYDSCGRRYSVMELLYGTTRGRWFPHSSWDAL